MTLPSDIVFKWIFATCNKVDANKITPYLPQFFIAVQRELKKIDAPGIIYFWEKQLPENIARALCDN